MECVAHPHLNPSVTSRCVSLRPSMYADVRCIDDVIAIEGHIGFAANLLSMLGSFTIPPLVELAGLQHHWKWVIMALLFTTAAGVAVFTYLVYDRYETFSNHSNHSNHSNATAVYGNSGTTVGSSGGSNLYDAADAFGPAALPPLPGAGRPALADTHGLTQIGIAFCVSNFAYGGNAVLGLELASEIVFPVSEESAAAYMTLMYQLFNIVLMEAGNVKVMSHLNFNLLSAGMFGLCTLLVLPVASVNARLIMDAKDR